MGISKSLSRISFFSSGCFSLDNRTSSSLSIGSFFAWAALGLVALFQGTTIFGMAPLPYAILVVALAFLIDKEGTACTAEEISAAMWEHETDMRVAKANIRRLVSDIKQVLSLIGLENALVRRSGQVAIRRDMVDCDYYRMLEGDISAVNSFYGEYMTQYQWAELSEGRLYFRNI